MDPSLNSTTATSMAGPPGSSMMGPGGPGGPNPTVKAIIKNADMTDEMQQDSVDIASAALEKYNIEKDIAANIKKEFDKKYGPTWHVVVGKNFGSYVTHGELSCLPFVYSAFVNERMIETKHFIYFYIGTLAILLWKS
jgi:dynein light chain LC8-type